MSSLNDKLLRFMGYTTVGILILVVIITVYLIYSLATASPFSHDNQHPTDMEQDLQGELNKNNQLDPNAIVVPGSNNANAAPAGYQSPASKIPDAGSYNPFEDHNEPIAADPAKVVPQTGGNTAGVEDLPLNIQAGQSEKPDNSTAMPIDPTKKNPRNNLDILF